MNSPPFIYIITENALYGTGMVFDPNGEFCYALDSEDIASFVNASIVQYIIIDPREKTVFKDIQEKESIESIGRYFNNIFKENSPLIDSMEYFSSVFSKVIAQYTFVGKNILDYGSGNRKYSSFFKKGNYVSYDIYDLNIVNKKILNYDYDFIICNFVLEHVANPFDVINNAISYLKKGGIFIISIPTLTFYEFIKYYLFRIKLNLPLFHIRTFSVSNFKGCMSFFELEHFLNQNKIKVVDTISINTIHDHNILFRHRPFNLFGNQIIFIGERFE